MRLRLAVMVLLAACGNDSSPPAIDAPMSTIDAAIDAPGVVTLNGCTAAAAVDLTAAGATRTIVLTDDKFTPKCSKIQVGQSVTWTGSFSDHPLAPGIIRTGSIETQPGSPIPTVTSGTTRTVAFPTAGDWAFYCTDHTPSMAGVVYVVP